MLTPKEVQEQTFKEIFRGYEPKAVDDFLDTLTEDYTTLYKENAVLKSKMKVLVEKLEEYRAQEVSLKNALVAAQKTSDALIAEAQKKSAKILNAAESAVTSKNSTVQQEIAAERQRVEKAKKAAQSFIAAIEHDVQAHVEMLDNLKKISAVTKDAPKPVFDYNEGRNVSADPVDSVVAQIEERVAADMEQTKVIPTAQSANSLYGKEFSFDE